MSQNFSSDDPRYYATRIRFMIQNVITQVKEDRTKIDDEAGRVLLQDSEARLLELANALENYVRRNATSST